MYYNGQIRRQITATKKKTTTKTSRIVCIFYSPIVLVILCSYSRVNITSYISASFRNFFYCDIINVIDILLMDFSLLSSQFLIDVVHVHRIWKPQIENGLAAIQNKTKNINEII